MPQPRTPLTSISGNRQIGTHLTSCERAYICGRVEGGATFAELGRQFSVQPTTIRTAVSKVYKRQSFEVKTRSGRPKSCSIRTERRIIREIRRFPKLTYEEVRTRLDLEFSRSTLYRILRDNGITNWLAKERPFLTEEHVYKRLLFARKYIHLSEQDWRQWIWSDECSVERGSGKQKKWVFRQPHEKWKKEMVETYKKSKDVSVMVWAGISGGLGRSDLVVLSRDFQSAKMGYSAASYIALLEEVLPDYYQPGFIFMQDNAPIHCARSTKEWLERHGIWVLEGWPPCSPDLNPIEHLWWHLKKYVYQANPKIETITGTETIRAELGKALRAAWKLIPDEIVEGVLGSMKSRLQAVIDADGWYTKY